MDGKLIHRDSVQQNDNSKQESNKPTIESDGTDVYIFCGDNTIYINEEFSMWGISTKHPDDRYDKRIAKAVAYYNAFEERGK